MQISFLKGFAFLFGSPSIIYYTVILYAYINNLLANVNYLVYI